MGRTCSTYGAIQKFIGYRVIVGRPEEKKTSGRTRRRWEDNIKIDLREVGCDPGEWIDLAEDRDQWRACIRAVMNLESQLVS